MTQPLKLTKYSGSKTRLLKYLPPIPPDTKRLVELYAGSLAWILNNPPYPFIAYEINPKMIALYEWLKNTTPQEIQNLKDDYNKVDVRTLNLPLGVQTYYQLNMCSVVLGQLSSWTITNPKYRLPKQRTIDALPRLHQGTIISGDCSQYVYQDGDYILADPPYENTKPNYKIGEKRFVLQNTINILDKIPRGRWMMTYSSIPTEFSKYNVKELLHIKVPNIRKGGCTERIEYLFT